MASYQSGFDPASRPGDPARNKRMGVYTQQGLGRLEGRGASFAQLSGQMKSLSGQNVVSQPQYSGLPRPTIRDPFPSTRSIPDAKSRGVTGSVIGFGKPAGRTAAPAAIPKLKGKSSRNVLRRKPSSVAWQQAGDSHAYERSGSSSPTKWSSTSAERRPSIESSLKSAEAYNEIFSVKSTGARESPRIIPELDRYGSRPEQPTGRSAGFMTNVPKLATQDLPPPTPLSSAMSGRSALSPNSNRYSGYSAYSASPSTRFSESPGPGAYSRDTTPTSMSSQSPGVVAPMKAATPRLRQGSPAFSRPPVTRRKAGSTPNEIEGELVDAQGLSALRESVTSSSSNSTAKGDGKPSEKKKKKKRLSPLPPSPPPRKSSQKFKKSPTNNHKSPSKASQAPARQVMIEASDTLPLKTRKDTSDSQFKNIPPTRPSREGTPSLQSQVNDSVTVIQSNLAGISLPKDRRFSGLPRGTSPSQLQPARSHNPKPASGYPPSNSIQLSQREGTPAPSGPGTTPDLRPQEVHPAARATATRTPSPSITSTKTRFGLFGRRTKTAATDVPTLENKEKVSRRGPAAGTGHEGYGRYGLRGRSVSAGGQSRTRDRSTSGASTSQESLASTRSHDPFLLDRMSPVIIAGGGEIIENRNASSELTRSETNTSISDSKGSGSTKTSLSNEASHTTLWPSALPRDPTKRASRLAISTRRRPSDSSDDDMREPSSLAFRRSMQRLNSSAAAVNLPQPITIPHMGISPSLRSQESSLISDDSRLEARAEVDRGRRGQLSKPKKLEKRPRSPRKWNFFHRAQMKDEAKVEVALPVTIGRAPVKAVPHYALLDSSDDQQDAGEMDLKDILRDADVIDLSDGELDSLQFGEHKENLRRIEQLNSMMETPIPDPIPERPPIIFSTPEPRPATPEFQQAEVALNKDIAASKSVDLHLTKDTTPSRPSRLPQVGRIPKVISARPVATSPKSFSRPFARLSTTKVLLEPAVLDEESVGLGLSPPRQLTPEPIVHPDANFGTPAQREELTDHKLEGTSAHHKDFLAFSPRKNSEATTSSSGGLSFAGTTAIVPEADAELEEDEVWDEYDDLIENDRLLKIPVSAASSTGLPFQYESYESRRLRKSRLHSKEQSEAPISRGSSSPTRRSVLTTSTTFSADMAARMKDAFTVVPSPTTPMSFTDFFSGYEERNNSIQGASTRNGRRPSQGSSRKSASSNTTMLVAEQDSSSPISQVNLRVGSMTVSKWLTFGHVLFSPAREQLMQIEGSMKRHSILVIDGLGNGTS